MTGAELNDRRLGESMKKAMLILAAATALTACATEKNAATSANTVGEWQIAVNDKAGPGCYATRHFVNPTSQVQMGINATTTPPSGYLAIYVQGYEGIHPGEAIPATFKVGDREFKGTFRGQDTDGFGGATVPVDNANFIYELGNYDNLTISYGQDRRVIVPLDDVDPAIAAL
jgi:hypothetical protein